MNVVIRDPELTPYHITKDKYCYTVMQTVTPQEKYLEEGSTGKNYEKSLGHYGDFAHALEAVYKAKLDDSNQDYESVADYIKTWKSLQSEMKTLIEKIDL